MNPRKQARWLVLLSLGLWLWPALALAGNSVSISCDKTHMTLDDVLQCSVQVTVTDEDKVQSLKDPVLEGFKILSQGTSTSTEIQMINFRTTQRKVTTTNYELQALRTGSLRVGPAGIVQQNGVVQSNVISVQVAEAIAAPAAERYGADALTAPLSDKELNEGNLFLRLLPDKSDVTVGEQLTVSLYIYHWNMPLGNPSLVSGPDFSGFWMEELELDEQNQTRRVSIGRRVFNATLVKRLALFPNQAGEITIDPYRLKFNTGGLFNRGRSLTRSTSPVVLRVLPLPEEGRPADFQPNNVGAFTLSASVDRRTVEQFSPVQLTVTLSGRTNMGKIAAPAPEPIAEVKSYPPTIREDSAQREMSLWGRKTAEYLLVPQQAGRFTIPPVRFSYFDTKARQYRTLQSRSFSIQVRPSSRKPATDLDGGFASKQRLRVSADDLRPLRFSATLEPATAQGEARRGIAWMVFLGLGILAVIYGLDGLLRLRARLAQGAEARYAAAKNEETKRIEQAMSDQPEAALAGIQRYLVLLAQGAKGRDLRGATREELRKDLERTQPNAAWINTLMDLLEACDQARFMPGGASSQRVRELWQQTQALEREAGR